MRGLLEQLHKGDRVTGIIPTGIETTVTRKQLLDYREAEEQRLREQWAKEKESEDDTSK